MNERTAQAVGAISKSQTAQILESAALLIGVLIIAYILFQLYTRHDITPDDRDRTFLMIVVFIFIGGILKFLGHKLQPGVLSAAVGGLFTSVGTIIAFYHKERKNNENSYER